MKGNFHVPFLEGLGPVTAPGYSARGWPQGLPFTLLREGIVVYAEVELIAWIVMFYGVSVRNVNILLIRTYIRNIADMSKLVRIF